MASKSLKTPGYAFPVIPEKYDSTGENQKKRHLRREKMLMKAGVSVLRYTNPDDVGQDRLAADIAAKIEEKKAQFDLPVDSYILEKMWDLEEIEIPLHAEKRIGKYSADKVKPWNQWNKDEYMAFRESVHNSIKCPLDWEGPVWIEVAKSRASK